MSRKLFFLLLLFSNKAISQEIYSIEQGLYFGEISSQETGVHFGGHYWFGKDSSFLMLRLKDDSSVLCVGAGKYYFTDSNYFALEFKNIPDLYFSTNIIQYKAETKGSGDSIYFSGIILGKSGRPLKGSSISFPGIEAKSRFPSKKVNPSLPPVYAGVIADTLGRYYFVLPAKIIPKFVQFNSLFGCPLEINIMNHFNYHTINVTLNLDCMVGHTFSETVISSNVEKVMYLKEAEKIIWPVLPIINKNTFKGNNFYKFEKLSDSKEKLLQILSTAKQKQPNLEQQLGWLEENLRKY